MDVRPEISSIFADIFKFSGPLTGQTSREDVPRWDSLQHMNLVTALEENFGISLSMDEMIEIHSVQDITNILDRHGIG